MGGSPCTHWSIAQTKNRETEPSGLGWELFKNYAIGLNKYRADYFLYENNKSMSPAIKEQITKELGVEPILINSALVSAQNRNRLYWTNIPGVIQPEDRGILLKDIFETSVAAEPFPFGTNDAGKAHCLDANYWKGSLPASTLEKHRRSLVAVPCKLEDLVPYVQKKIDTIVDKYGYLPERFNPYNTSEIKDKTPTLTANMGRQTSSATVFSIIQSDGTQKPIYEVKNGFITIKEKQHPIKLSDGYYIIRKLTVNECMRLQTVPDSYFFPVSNTQAYKMLGNGWTVDVIAHILSFVPGINAEEIEVVSMYDGMSCGHIALDKLKANVVKYFATEIDKYAIKTTQANYPETVHLGDAYQVRNVSWIH